MGRLKVAKKELPTSFVSFVTGNAAWYSTGRKIKMKWLRANIRQVTSLALFALAINLVLSFGHLHLEDIDGGQATSGVLLSVISHHTHRHNDKHHGHPDDLCPICMALAALGTGFAASAPALTIDLAYVELDPISAPELAVPQPPRASFQSRGPPFSERV
jgi:hypothetical protein